jgi:hypothetical protein
VSPLRLGWADVLGESREIAAAVRDADESALLRP